MKAFLIFWTLLMAVGFFAIWLTRTQINLVGVAGL